VWSFREIPSGQEATKTSKFTEEQILLALKQGDAGQPIADVSRQMEISEATYYIRRKRYANMGLLEVRELRRLRDAAWYYRSPARDNSVLRQRARELATARPRFGYERLHIRPTREGWRTGRNRGDRPCKLEGLQVGRKVRRRKRISLHRGPVPPPPGRRPVLGDGFRT
jgi:hypothetical protein